jgi:serine protease Do
MRCTFTGLILLLAFPQPPRALAQNDDDLLRALERSTTKIIAQHESAIACILVSRSEWYPRDAKNPGKLGGYDPSRLLIDPKATDIDRALLQKKLDLADPNNVPPAFGSGVVIDPQGLILTNYHVIENAAKIYVRLPGGRGAYADIHAADSRSDLAVLKLLNPSFLPLKAITLGDADKMERGQFVLTLANPFAAGFRDGQPSASAGILSNVRRRSVTQVKEEDRIRPLHFYSTLLQTDARLHLGSSGGALLNRQGEMVGLLTSMAAIHGGDTPGGFALPINEAMRRVIDVLKRGEEVDYGFLGVNFKEMIGNGQPGVVLFTVGPNSPADVDGRLVKGDVILAVNGQSIHDIDDGFLFIGKQLAGTKVKLLVRRGPVERIAEVTLAKLYVPGKRLASSTGSRPFVRGLRVDYASLVVQQEPRWAQIPSGVLVSAVQANSAADRANLKAGDVITHVNQVRVTTPAAFYQAIGAGGEPVELTLHNEPPTKVILKK